MNIEIAKKVAELLKTKSKYIENLSILTDPEYKIGLASNYIGNGFYFGYNPSFLSIPDEVNTKFSEQAKVEVQGAIDKIDQEISELNC